MLGEGVLAWMQPPPRHVPMTVASVDGDDMKTAAQQAVLSLASRQKRSDRFSRTMNTPADVDVPWVSLSGQSSSWDPAGPMERRGHLPHSLAAFRAAFDLGDKVAGGGFATVHRAIRRIDGDVVAVKRLMSSPELSPKECKAEVDLNMKLDHKSVIRTIDAYWSMSGSHAEVLLVEEFCHGGELFSWARARDRPLSASEHRRLAYELLSGLAYLHSHGCVHRDIKPKNILMTSTADDATLRIADFGLSRLLKSAQRRSSSLEHHLPPAVHQGHGKARGTEQSLADLLADPSMALHPAKQRTDSPRRQSRKARITRTFVGTADWMAPEVILCACDGASGYSFPADVWGAGCVLFSLITGKLDERNGPFTPGDGDEGDLEAVFVSILERRLNFESIPDGPPRALLTRLLSVKPSERISASSALSDEWLAPLSGRDADLQPLGSSPQRNGSHSLLPTANGASRSPSRNGRQHHGSLSNCHANCHWHDRGGTAPSQESPTPTAADTPSNEPNQPHPGRHPRQRPAMTGNPMMLAPSRSSALLLKSTPEGRPPSSVSPTRGRPDLEAARPHTSAHRRRSEAARRCASPERRTSNAGPRGAQAAAQAGAQAGTQAGAQAGAQAAIPRRPSTRGLGRSEVQREMDRCVDRIVAAGSAADSCDWAGLRLPSKHAAAPNVTAPASPRQAAPRQAVNTPVAAPSVAHGCGYPSGSSTARTAHGIPSPTASQQTSTSGLLHLPSILRSTSPDVRGGRKGGITSARQLPSSPSPRAETPRTHRSHQRQFQRAGPAVLRFRQPDFASAASKQDSKPPRPAEVERDSFWGKRRSSGQRVEAVEAAAASESAPDEEGHE